MKEVVVYSKNMCGYCVQAKNWLKNKGIEYKEVNIEEQPEAREFVINEGHRTMPQIYIDGKSMGGYTELVKLDESAFN
jgi:glutaredoxin 3